MVVTPTIRVSLLSKISRWKRDQIECLTESTITLIWKIFVCLTVVIRQTWALPINQIKTSSIKEASVSFKIRREAFHKKETKLISPHSNSGKHLHLSINDWIKSQSWYLITWARPVWLPATTNRTLHVDISLQRCSKWCEISLSRLNLKMKTPMLLYKSCIRCKGRIRNSSREVL